MSIETAVQRKALPFPTIRMPKRPKLSLHRHLCNALEAYVAAVSMTYGAAIGLCGDALTRESGESERNY